MKVASFDPLTFLYQLSKFSLKLGILRIPKAEKAPFSGLSRMQETLSQSVSPQRNQHGFRNSSGSIMHKGVQGYPKRRNWFQDPLLQFSSIVMEWVNDHSKEEFTKFWMAATGNQITAAHQLSGLLYTDTCLRGILLMLSVLLVATEYLWFGWKFLLLFLTKILLNGICSFSFICLYNIDSSENSQSFSTVTWSERFFFFLYCASLFFRQGLVLILCRRW